MRYPTSYSTKQQLALLQIYLAMMDGEIIDFEYFNELTGYGESYYKLTMSAIKSMIYDLHLKCDFQKITQIVETNKTTYKVNSYVLLSKFDYSFKLNKEIPDEKKMLYSSVIVYLELKKEFYVSYDILSNYLPNFSQKTFIHVIEGIKEVIADEVLKNEIQSYELNIID